MGLIPAPYRMVVMAGVAALALSSVAGGAWYVQHLRNSLTAARAQVAADKAQATVTAGQTAAVAAGAAIADQGARRDALTITVHQENARAIQAASDPAPVARIGLCRYAAYAADPGCAGLHQGDPAQLPPADTSDSTPPF